MEVDEAQRHHILATTSVVLGGTHVLKHGDMFAVFDAHGDIQPFDVPGAHGLYHEGARFLSKLRLKLDGGRPLLLSSNVQEDGVTLAVDMMNPDMFRGGELVVPHGTVHVLRSKFLWQGGCFERLEFSNFESSVADLVVRIEFGADFVDVFEVRGTARERRGQTLSDELGDSHVSLSYLGLDQVKRTTRLSFDPPPTQVRGDHVVYKFQLEAKQRKEFFVYTACTAGDSSSKPRKLSFAAPHTEARAAFHRLQEGNCRVQSSNELFNNWLTRSISDLAMMTTDTEHGPFPYAGVPWFSTPFGRDAIIAALSSMWLNPQLAHGVLRFLAASQADSFDSDRDAEPGKILHEMRKGEMAALREIPFAAYYGSVDSTPLFVMLAAQYYDITGDRETARSLWPHVERALNWIDSADADRDGFIEYGRQASDGLIQQGWKDSDDSVFHADGSIAVGPIALCEVQGYVYAARCGAARLARALELTDRATELERAAELLKTRFDEKFWCDDLGMYALALDGEKRPCRVRSSNAGQCLYSGIVQPRRAGVLADQLLSEEMFSGWGIRTLGKSERRYNPLSYHNGSIWPHDNALIGAGLARYGLKKHLGRLLEGLFEASQFVTLHRLPELFCGFARRPGDGPTSYPVACSPQTWAATVPLLLLQAVLGMRLEGAQMCISFDHPLLPGFVRELRLSGLRVGNETADMVLRRHPDDVGIHVLKRSSKELRVTTVK